MSSALTLDAAVGAFVDELVPVIEQLAATVAGVDVARLRSDVVVDAYNLACGFVDGDERLTDGELWALISAFGPRMPTQLGRATPADVREAGLLRGRRSALARPSPLLDVLGTGKTTVARLLAQIYRTLGVVERGHLVESDRAGLVAGFVGQTAKRVVDAFDRADQGVLLIDEAYSLARGGENDFGREAIDMLVKLVEDRRDRVVVILAGYPHEMAMLVETNPGMESRFPRTIHFPDYSDDELVAIVDSLGRKRRYHLDDPARAVVRAWLAAQPRDPGFGNGRLARNLFETAVVNQASRLVDLEHPTNDQLTTLTATDIPAPSTPPTPAAPS